MTGSSNGRWSPRTERAMTSETRLYAHAFAARCVAEEAGCWALLFAGVAGLLFVRARERSRRVAELQLEDNRRLVDERARAAVRPVPMPAAADVDEHQADG